MGDGKENRGKSEENEHSEKERGTRIGNQTFLDTKDREGERNRKRESELLERASGTIVERGNAVEPRCFSERTEKVISIDHAGVIGAKT